MVKSKKYEFNKEDMTKIGKSFLIAGAGFVLTFATDLIPMIEWGEYKAVVVAVSSVLINACWKFLKS